MKKKLLKFDIIHPPEYLKIKHQEWNDIDALSLSEYRDRLISLRSNYSDFYTYHLDESGDWDAEEFFLMDPVFIEKVATEILGFSKNVLKIESFLREKIQRRYSYFYHQVIHKYIENYKPDVIFVRSHPLPSQFWQRYNTSALLVSRLSARLPKQWHPNDWDLNYTDSPEIRNFFEMHGARTIMNDQGFDRRIMNELEYDTERYNCTFVGGLGTQNFSKRTDFLEKIASIVDFKWWGYWWKYGGDGRTLKDFPNLNTTFQGITSGKEMYQIYADSKICINDYVDTSNGMGFNQRIFEVLGSGGFLLTKTAENLKKTFPKDIFVTFDGLSDCIDKIQYFQNAPDERKEMALAGQKFIKENYDYSRIAMEFGEDLKSHHAIKFPKS